MKPFAIILRPARLLSTLMFVGEWRPTSTKENWVFGISQNNLALKSRIVRFVAEPSGLRGAPCYSIPIGEGSDAAKTQLAKMLNSFSIFVTLNNF